MKHDDIYTFESLLKQFKSLHKELSIVSSNSPKEDIGKLKMERINNLLKQANAFLDVLLRPFDDFTIFTGDKTNYSDAVLVIGQYVECLKGFRDRNVKHRYDKWYWVIDIEDGEPDDKRYVTVVDTKDLDK